MPVIKGEGTTLSYNTVALGQVISLSGPNMEVPEVETTDLASTHKTFRPSEIPDGGTLDFECYYDDSDAAQTTVRGLMDNPATGTWKVDFNVDGTATHSASFEGFPTSLEFGGMEVEGNVTLSGSVKVTGAVTFA